MTLLLATLVAGCGSGGNDPILGGVGGAGGIGGTGPAGAAPALGVAAAFGGFGGNAGMTNQGTSTVITGAQGQPVSIGTTGVATTMTGFHSTPGCIYTETGSNIGAVNGTINTNAPPPGSFTGACTTEANATTLIASSRLTRKTYNAKRRRSSLCWGPS